MNTKLAIERIIKTTTVPGDIDHHAAKCYLISLHVLGSFNIAGATSDLAAKNRYAEEYINPIKRQLSDLCKIGPINTALCISQCYKIYQYYSLAYRGVYCDFHYVMANPVFMAKYADYSYSLRSPQSTESKPAITTNNIISLWKDCAVKSAKVDIAATADTCKVLLNDKCVGDDLMVADNINPRSMIKTMLVPIDGISSKLANLSMEKPDEIITADERAKATDILSIYRQTVEDILFGMRTLDASGQDGRRHLGFYLATKMLMGDRVADWAAAMATQYALSDTLAQSTKALTPREYFNL